MPQNHIHRTGPVLPKTYPAKLTAGVKANSILAGNLLALELASGVNALVPASAWVWTTDEQTTSRAFAAAFAGIAGAPSNASKPSVVRDIPVLVSQDGEYEVTVASAAYPVGTLLKPVKAAGNALTDILLATTDALSAIFVVSEAAPSGSTRVRAYILKTMPKRLGA